MATIINRRKRLLVMIAIVRHHSLEVWLHECVGGPAFSAVRAFFDPGPLVFHRTDKMPIFKTIRDGERVRTPLSLSYNIIYCLLPLLLTCRLS